jgi:hypothetical protein
MSDQDWHPIATAPQHQTVLTKIHDDRGARNEQALQKHGNLWFYPDAHMYVYYSPTHWKRMAPLPAPPTEDHT